MHDKIKELSKSAKKVQDTLLNKNMDFQVIELSESTRTANDAASAIGCTVNQIVKSLIFKTKESNKPILVLASGPNRVSENQIEKYVGEKIGKADADFTREVTGYAIGGIPPIAHAQLIETYVDEDLLNFEELWAAAGTPNSVFKLYSKNLVELTGGKVISIKD